ncbi:MAG: NCS2 family permease [Elusimicrobia bacterium]|nr:NCS2 family permease [Elusimicrobiota bacterium]
MRPPGELRREAIGGVTTFFTMAYIVVVNPAILATEGTGMPFSGALTATVLLSASMTLLMGLYARLPFAVAPGMGLNAFFAYSIVIGQQVPWRTALGIVFWAGVLFLALSLTPLRARVALAIPANLRTAAAAGIGLFLAFIGLRNAGLVAAHPATLVQLGPVDRRTLLSLAGLAVIVWLMKRKSPFAFLAGIAAATAGAAALGLVEAPLRLASRPDFSSAFLELDVWGALRPALAPAIAAILMTDLFDSLSTFVGVSEACGLLDENGQPRRLKQGLIVDALATLGAGLAGTSSGTAFIESAAGIEAGGRTGLASVVTAFCFLPCFFLAPLAELVPACATAPVLIVVGALMFRSAARLDLARLEDALPAFLTLALIPLTFSITQGILWGFISQAALYLVAGRGRELKPSLYALAAVSVALLVVERG